jgi:hypothetical protein
MRVHEHDPLPAPTVKLCVLVITSTIQQWDQARRLGEYVTPYQAAPCSFRTTMNAVS